MGIGGALKKGFSKLPGFFKDHGLDILSMAASATPGGGAVALARDIAAGVAGVREDAAEDEIIQVYRDSPDKLTELKLQENAHRERLVDATVEDRKSARDMRIALKGDNIIIGGLAAVAIFGFLSTLYILIFVPVAEGVARDALLIMLGALVVIVKDVYGFFFGSSNSSQKKDSVIAAGR